MVESKTRVRLLALGSDQAQDVWFKFAENRVPSQGDEIVKTMSNTHDAFTQNRTKN